MEDTTQLEKLFDAKLGGIYTRLDGIEREIKLVQKKQDYTNGTVKENKEWILENKTDIASVIERDKRFIVKLFDLAWKAIVAVVAVVFGLTWLK